MVRLQQERALHNISKIVFIVSPMNFSAKIYLLLL